MTVSITGQYADGRTGILHPVGGIPVAGCWCSSCDAARLARERYAVPKPEPATESARG